jgi:dihydrofolate reductase
VIRAAGSYVCSGTARLTPHLARLSLIVAMGKNRVIGANGTIPWRLPNELQLFKRVTMGHPIIMGRKTWESINRLLPGRTTIIVTRQAGYWVSGATVVNSLDAALAACAGDDEAFIIGGGELYKLALPLAQRIYLTTVDTSPVGDTHMPDFDMKGWNLVSSEQFNSDEKHAHAYQLAIYERASN